MDGTSGSGAGGSSWGASRRISNGGDIVVVDSAVSGAAMVVRVDSSVGADNVRPAVPGVEGDIEPLLANGRSKSVAAGKAEAGPRTPGASVSAITGAARLTEPDNMFTAGKQCCCHIGIALRNFKLQRTLMLASVRRDKPRHDCGLDLASSLTSSWVIIHQ